MNTLKEYEIKRFDKKKAYLKTQYGEASISKKLTKGLKQNDKLKCFIYRDKKNILRAKTDFKYEINKVYMLKVVDINSLGAFFDLHLEFDLLCPSSELKYKVFKDMYYPVGLKQDEIGRLYATLDISKLLRTDHNYKENDMVEGYIYSINKSIGAFVACDLKYDSLIRINELKGAYTEGEKIRARVKNIKPDGKLDLTLRQRAYLEIDRDSQKILNALKLNGGRLDIGDKSKPEKIRLFLNMSKSSFKRACGRLYKLSKIKINDYNIQLKGKGYNG